MLEHLRSHPVQCGIVERRCSPAFVDALGSTAGRSANGYHSHVDAHLLRASRGLVWEPSRTGIPASEGSFWGLTGARNIDNDTLLATTDAIL